MVGVLESRKTDVRERKFKTERRKCDGKTSERARLRAEVDNRCGGYILVLVIT